LGNINLAVAVKEASIEAVKATQAAVTHDSKERRGTAVLDEAGAAAAFVAAGLGGGGTGFAGAVSTDSSLLIGISQSL